MTWQSQPPYQGNQVPFATSVSGVSSGLHIKAGLAAGMDSFIRFHSLYLLAGNQTNQKWSRTSASSDPLHSGSDQFLTSKHNFNTIPSHFQECQLYWAPAQALEVLPDIQPNKNTDCANLKGPMSQAADASISEVTRLLSHKMSCWSMNWFISITIMIAEQDQQGRVTSSPWGLQPQRSYDEPKVS